MVTMCFVGKSPRPTARVFGLGDIGISESKFEKAVVGLVGMPDDAMTAGRLDPADRFRIVARAELLPGQIWTWIGDYRSVLDNFGREGAYLGAGVLLLNQTAPGESLLKVLDDVAHVAERDILDGDKIRGDLSALQITPGNPRSSTRVDRLVTTLDQSSGLSSASPRILYCYTELVNERSHSDLLDRVQSGSDFRPYSRLIFDPSPSFGEKLNANGRIGRAILRENGLLEIAPEASAEPEVEERAPIRRLGYSIAAPPMDQDPPSERVWMERRLSTFGAQLDKSVGEAARLQRAIASVAFWAAVCAAVCFGVATVFVVLFWRANASRSERSDGLGQPFQNTEQSSGTDDTQNQLTAANVSGGEGAGEPSDETVTNLQNQLSAAKAENTSLRQQLDDTARFPAQDLGDPDEGSDQSKGAGRQARHPKK